MGSVSPFGENLRSPVLCQPWRISQSHKSVLHVHSQSLMSVSHMLNISESQVCVYVMNISILLICVKRIEYLRVSSLCPSWWISQKIRSFVSISFSEIINAFVLCDIYCKCLNCFLQALIWCNSVWGSINIFGFNR